MVLYHVCTLRFIPEGQERIDRATFSLGAKEERNELWLCNKPRKIKIK